MYGPYAETEDQAGANSNSVAAETVLPNADGEPSANSNVAAPPKTVLYFKDKTSVDVSQYWLEGGDIHYITTYNASGIVSFSNLDMQKTVDQNYAHGAPFQLTPPG